MRDYLRLSGWMLFLLLSLLSQVTFAATVTRGPYLQMANDSEITIPWRTDSSTDSVVRYGDSFR